MHSVFDIYIHITVKGTVTKLPFCTDREFCMVQSVSQELEFTIHGLYAWLLYVLYLPTLPDTKEGAQSKFSHY